MLIEHNEGAEIHALINISLWPPPREGLPGCAGFRGGSAELAGEGEGGDDCCTGIMTLKISRMQYQFHQCCVALC